MTMFAYSFSLENKPENGKRPFVSFSTILRYLGMTAGFCLHPTSPSISLHAPREPTP